MGSETFAFIDAANIIYGCRGEGWKVDFKRLHKYLTERYECKQIFYFAGLEKDDVRQLRFYDYLKKCGYNLVLKPVKIFRTEKNVIKKANCDVDLTFYVMKDRDNFKRAIFLTGDGDFEILFKYLVGKDKEIIVFANATRTAKEIRRLEKIQFNDLSSLRGILEEKERRLRTSPLHVLHTNILSKK